MGIFDRLVLLATGLVAIYLIWHFVKRQKNPDTACASNIYYIISFAVLLVAGLLLIFFGWGALGNDLVAIVAGLIPFGLATGLISKFYPKAEKGYLIVMIIGLVLIIITRFAASGLGKVVLPIFHTIAGLTIFLLPIVAVNQKKVRGNFVLITVGGTLIGLGGIALSFLKAGKQLLFFSQDFVLLILAPLLFLMTLFFALGLVKGELAKEE